MTYWIYDEERYDDPLEAIKYAFDDLDEAAKVQWWNEYCSANYYEDHIFDMGEFNEYCSNWTPLEIAQKLEDADFHTNHDYFHETIYDFESSDYPSNDGWMDIDAIVEWLWQTEKYYELDGIEERPEDDDDDE